MKGTQERAAEIGNPRRGLPIELRCYLGVLVLLWAVALGTCFVISRQTGSADLGFKPLKMTNPFFDLICYIENFKYLHHVEFFHLKDFAWMYPAPTIFIYVVLYSLGHRHGAFRSILYPFLAFTFAVLAFLVIRLTGVLERRGLRRSRAALLLGLTALLSWPIYYSLQRANVETVIWFGVAAAVWAYARRKWMVAAVLIGVVGAFKLYPILLLALFLPARRFREIVVSAAVMASATLLSLWFMGPTISIAYHGVQDGVKHFLQLYTLGYDPIWIGYDHSLFTLVKVANKADPASYARYLPIYMGCAGLLMMVLFFARIVRLPRANQLMFVMLATVMLPPTSADYTLQSLYIPWFWLVMLIVSGRREGRTIRGALPAMLCFALLFGPETFLMSHGVVFAGQLKALVLLAATAIAAIFPFAGESADGAAVADNNMRLNPSGT